MSALNMRSILQSLYRELYEDEAVEDIYQARVDRYVSEARDFLLKYGCEYESALRDMVIIYIKHIDAFGSENKVWLMFFIWIFIVDNKIEKFDHELLLNTSFDDILNHGLDQEKRMYDDIVHELPHELRNSFKCGVRYWYDGVRLHTYEYANNSTSTISMYLARIQTCCAIPVIISALAFKICRLDMVDDIEFIRIMNAQNEFIMMANDLASYQKESKACDAYVASDKNVPAIVIQLISIEKTIELINTKYIGHPLVQINKIFLWWHCVARRYDPDDKKNLF
ncbi:MAG: hypothetical protein J3R72DRAFT_478063 [Linnemannia gamsii]|nr:MAG: hypothetical protein J3R72DRAFT_478063 [Linnemannia gamsii]